MITAVMGSDRHGGKTMDNNVGFFDLLLLLFIALKLMGYIDWSWWIILSPIWIIAFLVICEIITEKTNGKL